MSMSIGALRVAKYALPLAGLVGVAFGISATLEKLAPQQAEAALSQPSQTRVANPVSSSTRVALVIGNSEYPDANAPLRHPGKDAQALADELRRNGFDVEVQENLGKDEMKRAVDRFKGKIRPGVAALLAYGGFGIQIDRQTYMIPVDAQIWKETDVRRDGVSVDTVLSDMHARGADVKIAVLDASRRNPYERRFRGFSAGLAAIDAPAGTLLMSAAAPGKVAYDVDGEHSLLFGELLKEINAPGVSAETVFNHTRVGVSRSSNGEQVPLVSSSLIENFAFVSGTPRYGRRFDAETVAAAPPAAPRYVEPVQDEGVMSPKSSAVATSEPAPEPPAVTKTSTRYDLASRPADKPIEKVVERPVEKVAKPVEKPAERQVEKTREQKSARKRRAVDDVSEQIVREQPRMFIRRGWYGDNPLRFGGGFPRHSFMRPGFRF